MSSRISTRPRRTKVYDCNFRASEDYYRPVLDGVNRKYSGRSESGEGGLSSLRGALADAEASLGSRPRATPERDFGEQRRPLSALLDEAEGEDSSPFRRAGAGRRRLIGAADDAAEDDDFFSSRRVRESRARIAALEDEITSTKSSSRSKLRTADAFAEKVLDTVGLKNSDIGKARQFLEDESIYKRRSRAAAAEEEDTGSRTVAKWSKLNELESARENTESAAASRARQSRARLADLESEMEQLETRAAARERRSANVRALLQETAEVGGEAVEASTTTVRASALRVKKVSASATAEKKTVTF